MRRAVCLAFVLLIGCDSDAVAPDVNTIALTVVSGSGQSGMVGTRLPSALVIKATDANGTAVTNLAVNFHVTSGGGSVFAGSANTDAQGVARDYWTLGTSIADSQRLEARSILTNGQAVIGAFQATVVAGPAASIAAQAGDTQTTTPNGPVPIAPAVRVSDRYGNPIQGMLVTFAVASGGGSVTGATPITDVTGIATLGSWTLGSSLGPQTLTATAAGASIAGNPLTIRATAVQPNTWSSRAPMPTARAGLAVGVVNGILYAVGGMRVSNVCQPNPPFPPICPIEFLGTVEAYDPVSNAWLPKAPMPTPRSALAVAVVNGVLYAIGGNQGGNGLNAVEAYDPVTNTWTARAPMPTARFQLAAAPANGIVYAAGGSVTNAVATTVEAYDPVSNTWTTKAAMPAARTQFGLEAINGLLYAVGGQGPSGNVLNLDLYDGSTNTWTTKAPLPTGRYALGTGVANGTLYALGGMNGPLATVEAYDPVGNAWTTRAPMPGPRAYFAVGVVRGVVYAVGGYNQSFSTVGTVEAYQP